MIQAILVILSIITLAGGAIGTVDDTAPMFSAVILVFLLWKSFYDYRKNKETAEELNIINEKLEQLQKDTVKTPDKICFTQEGNK